MIDKLKETLFQASELVREQANTFSDTAKERSYQIIEDWLEIFPRLEEYGLKITSFGVSIAISPSLEVELKGEHSDFSLERIKEILEINKGNTALTSVFTAIKTTYNLHQRTKTELRDPLILKIKVKLTPEINVYLGEPIIL